MSSQHPVVERRGSIQQQKVPLAERLQQEDIAIACLQETHLKDTQGFSMRGFQVFRHDREGRTKGGVAILVKNTIPAQEFIVNTNNQSKIHGVTVKIEHEQVTIFNVYSPQDRDLTLDAMELLDCQCLIIGDFNSHLEVWGYEDADR